jgi:CHAD domain-containing protein
MRRANHAPAGQARDVALHETRKAAKRARYAAEAARPALGKKNGRKARRFAKRMKDVQSALGMHQDAVIAQAAAREIGVQAHLADENAFSFGLLNERAHYQTLACEDQAHRAWRRARRKSRWLPKS